MEVFKFVVSIIRYSIISLATLVLIGYFLNEAIILIRHKFKKRKESLKEGDEAQCIETFDPKFELEAEESDIAKKTIKEVRFSKRKMSYIDAEISQLNKCSKDDDKAI